MSENANVISFSDRTRAILNNFNSIHGSIHLKQGESIVIGESGGGVLAVATIDESIPKEFPIANLGGLLTILSMKSFADSKLDFSTDGLMKIAGKGQIVDFYASAETFGDLPEEPIPLEQEDFSAEITPDVFVDFKKACSGLNLTHCTLTVKDGKSSLVGNNPDLPNSSDFTIELGETDKDDVEITIKVASMKKVLEGNYVLVAQSEFMAKFVSIDERLQYMIGAEL